MSHEQDRAILEDALGCPRCKGSVNKNDATILCNNCGRVGARSLGFYDFLHDQAILDLAGGGRFDLNHDREEAAKLVDFGADSSFTELLGVANDGAEKTPASRAERRFSARYWKACNEVGCNHGAAILSKVNAFLSHSGRPNVSRGIAVEAGGGHGFFVPDFARYFSALVFIDCSLRNLVLARRLAEELSLLNVIYVRADVTALPLKPHSADMIHANGVIEHVASPQAMVDEALQALSPNGTYICLSPNRYPISPEPHFRVPLYGIFPPRVRQILIRRTRGISEEAGTDLLSLSELRSCFDRAGAPDAPIFFLPPHLPSTARSGAVREFVRFLLTARATARIADVIFNRVFLRIAPYHVAVKQNIPQEMT